MIPQNLEAEADLLGAMLLSADAAKTGLELVNAEDFYDQSHSSVFAAIRALRRRGDSVDVSTVSEELAHSGLAGSELRAKMVSLTMNVPVTSHSADYAKAIVRHASARRVLHLCAETTKSVGELADPYEAADSLAAGLAAVDAPVDQSKQEALTVEQIIDTSEDVSPWVIEGLIRLDWRVLLVAGEGQGKSVILRQIAMMAAQGIHPFRHSPMTPIRSLIVDLENPAAAIAETGSRIASQLRRVVGDAYDPTRCRVFRRPGGIDPRMRHDRGELEREILLQKPDLVCLGPAYKMLHRRTGRDGNESHEESTDPVLEVLDDLRTRYGFGLMIEHHAPQGYGAGSREMRPYGSQRWLAWPEVGLSLKRDPTVPNSWELGRHRGDRLITNWPNTLSHGTTWPWNGTWTERQEF